VDLLVATGPFGRPRLLTSDRELDQATGHSKVEGGAMSAFGSGLLEGRVVLLAGVGPQIGSATALIAAREGARLALVARATETTEFVAETIRGSGGVAIALTCDLGNREQLGAAVGNAVEQLRSYGEAGN